MRVVLRLVLVAFLALLLIGSWPAAAVPTVSRAELKGGQLRVEGRGAVRNAAVTVASTGAGESTATGNADSSGGFRVTASGFRSSTCRVTVRDGTGSTTATLSGCNPSTPSPTPTPTPTPTPPPSACTITPQGPATYNVGDLQTYFWSTTGCRTSNQPVQWNLVSGQIPPGMDGPFTQGVGSGFVTGRPTTVGTFTFTVRVRDQVGATDTETFTIVVEPARGLTVTTQGFLPGTVGQFYCCGNLFADGGTPGYSWAIVAGAIPPGLNLQRSPGRITGTPTVAGTYTFAVQATDSVGATSAATTFTLEIRPAG